jgi:hypothetical protein
LHTKKEGERESKSQIGRGAERKKRGGISYLNSDIKMFECSAEYIYIYMYVYNIVRERHQAMCKGVINIILVSLFFSVIENNDLTGHTFNHAHISQREKQKEKKSESERERRTCCCI